MKIEFGGSLLVSLLFAGCTAPEPGAPEAEQGMSSEISEVFDQLSDQEAAEAGSCISLASYDVIARSELGGYAETAVVVNNYCVDYDVPVLGLELLDRDGGFSLLSNIPETIPAGGSVEILIGFEPTGEHIHEGALRLYVSDPFSPFQAAQLFGLVGDTGLRAGAAPNASGGGGYFSVATGASATLDASASSDPEGDALSYAWSFQSVPGSSSVTNGSIADRFAQVTSYTPDVDGTYRVRLVVSDGTSIDKTFMEYTATSGALNSAPSADAGTSMRILPGDTATLDGSASSDPDGDALSYTWTLHSAPGGSALTSGSITGASSATASVTPDVEGDYVFKLVVSDGQLSDAAYVAVRNYSNTAPVADGGPNVTINLGEYAYMDGSLSSDPDGDKITYSWSFRDYAKGSALSNDDIVNRSKAKAFFMPDVTGQFRMRLTVLDSFTQDADFIYVTVN